MFLKNSCSRDGGGVCAHIPLASMKELSAMNISLIIHPLFEIDGAASRKQSGSRLETIPAPSSIRRSLRLPEVAGVLLQLRLQARAATFRALPQATSSIQVGTVAVPISRAPVATCRPMRDSLQQHRASGFRSSQQCPRS